MNNWETHDFAPSGTLKPGETHIDVYSEDKKGWDTRMDELKPPSFPPIDKKTREWEHTHEKYKQKVRSDPSYQFLMKVAAFANIKLENMWNTPSEEPGTSAVSTGGGITNIQNPMDPVSREEAFQHKWTTIPEVSGLVYLNPTIFGHLHEAYEISQLSIPMEKLMISKGSTLFARLVAIRIKVSQFLSGLNYNLDKNYQRLLQQQTLCLRALRNKMRAKESFEQQYMVDRSQAKRYFNTIIGLYT